MSIFSRLDSYYSGKEVSSLPKQGSNLKPSERYIAQLKDKGINLEQLEGVLRTKGNMLIVSGAGSGKTTGVLHKLNYDTLRGELTEMREVNGCNVRVFRKVIVCTFLKSGAEDLRNRLAKIQREFKMQDTSRAFEFSTLHAEFKRVLGVLGYETNIIKTGSGIVHLRKACKDLQITGKRGNSLSTDELKDLEGAISNSRNRLDEGRYKADIYDDIGITETVLETLMSKTKFQRTIEGVMDFEDLQEELYQLVCVDKNPHAIETLENSYDFLYIDEFQDTSQIQYEILKVYAQGCKKVVAIGDDDQCIYSWRGSDISIITKKFIKDFNPTVIELSVNYRCPTNILEAIIPSIEKNTGRYSKQLRAAKAGGTIQVCTHSDYSVLAKTLVISVIEDVYNGKSVAVLCRTQVDGLLPAILLEASGEVDFSISGSGMGLGSYVSKQAMGVLDICMPGIGSGYFTALNALTKDEWSVKALIKGCKEKNTDIWSISLDDIEYSCPDIAWVVSRWREAVGESSDLHKLEYILGYYENNVYVSDTIYSNRMRGILSAIGGILKRGNFIDVADFKIEVNNLSVRLKSREKAKGSKVSVATVHEYKGKEADSVYIWNDSEKSFPPSKSDDMEEERRVHYIACTRAKEKSTIIAVDGKWGKFIGEMDLSKASKLKVITDMDSYKRSFKGLRQSTQELGIVSYEV